MGRLRKVGRNSSDLDGGGFYGREPYSCEVMGVLQEKAAEGTLNSPLHPPWVVTAFSSALLFGTAPVHFPLLPCTTGLGLVLLMDVAKIV